MEPKKPFVLLGESYGQVENPHEYTVGVDAHPMAPQDREVYEATLLDRDAMSGPLGAGPMGMAHNLTGRSREAYEACLREAEALRAVRGGLPDAPPDIAPTNPGAYSKVR